MPLVSKSFSIDIVPGKTPQTIHVSEKDIGRLYYISIVDDGTPFSIPSGTTAKVEGTIGPYGFSENADVINNTIIVTLRSKMTAIKGKVWTKIKLSNNGDIASTCAFWLDVDKAGAVEGQYIDPDTIPDPGGEGGSVLPPYSTSDIGKVLGIIDNGSGGAILAWIDGGLQPSEVYWYQDGTTLYGINVPAITSVSQSGSTLILE